MTEHVAYPGCYCVDCVEGAAKPLGWINAEPPSARITGDKDRENPVEGAPHTPLGAALIYAQKRIAALEEALEPFARMAAAYDPDEGDDDHEAWAFNARPTIGQLRKARAASGHEIVSKGERS